ncbi:MAG: PilZ domain-containing protein, partial [Gammaproteobacteria bacterium]|nr:PilZ domain-containing protein [Gammaproteobacteria bacterium]
REREHRIHSGIRNVQIKYPDLGDILVLLNHKIDQIAHSFNDPHSAQSDEIDSRPVNISASGIAFFQDSPLGHNTALEMNLTLYLDQQPLKLFGVVVDCIEQKTAEIEHYKISVEFDYIIEEDRDELVHYIMKQQNLALRKNSGLDDDLET